MLKYHDLHVRIMSDTLEKDEGMAMPDTSVQASLEKRGGRTKAQRDAAERAGSGKASAKVAESKAQGDVRREAERDAREGYTALGIGGSAKVTGTDEDPEPDRYEFALRYANDAGKIADPGFRPFGSASDLRALHESDLKNGSLNRKPWMRDLIDGALASSQADYDRAVADRRERMRQRDAEHQAKVEDSYRMGQIYDQGDANRAHEAPEVRPEDVELTVGGTGFREMNPTTQAQVTDAARMDELRDMDEQRRKDAEPSDDGGDDMGKSSMPSMREMMKSAQEQAADRRGAPSGYKAYGFPFNGQGIPIQNGYRQVFINRDDPVMPTIDRMKVKKNRGTL